MFRQFIGIITTILSAFLVTAIMFGNGQVITDELAVAWLILWVLTSFAVNLIVVCILNVFDGGFDL